MAYDPLLGEVILFGGYNYLVAADGDTWAFANDTWSNLTSSLTLAPPARWGASLVWDPQTASLILFGGRDVTSYLNDTWSFNGTWSLVPTAAAPSPRNQAQAAYDPVDGLLLLQGGGWRNLSSTTISYGDESDTWAFNGTAWANRTTAYVPSPGPRSSGQAAYDPWNRSVVEVGGVSSPINNGCAPTAPVETLVSNHTYAYGPTVGPGDVSQEMMAYDPTGPYLVMFGGYANSSAGCAQSNSTWVRAEGVWVNLSSELPTAPSVRYLGGLAYDAADQQVVLFGGNSHSVYLGDTWTFVPPPLSAVISSARLNGSAPFTANLTGAGLGGGVAGYSFNWSFGDGSPNNHSASVAHTFAAVGNYTVELNVTDGANRSAQTFVTVHVVSALASAPTASVPNGSAPLSERLSANPTGGQSPYSGTWSFGDGSNGTGLTVSHLYSAAGTFVANVTVTDAYGDVVHGHVDVDLSPTLRVAIPGGPPIGAAPFAVNFSANATGGTPPYQYAWTFGDGGVATGATSRHTYDAPGSYPVAVEATDSLGRNSTAFTNVTVVAPLSASISADQLVGLAPLLVSFEINASGGEMPYTLDWAFGDGTTATGLTVVHSYGAAGNYSVTAEVTDRLGDQVRALAAIAAVAPMTSSISASGSVTEQPSGISVAALRSGGSGPFVYAWTFGDGGTAAGPGPFLHTYSVAGSYVVRLTVSDALGEVDHESLGVSVEPALSLSLAAGAKSPWVGNWSNLTASVVGGYGPYSYAWTGLPTGCLPVDAAVVPCTPTAPGRFPVEVTVTDALNRTANATTTLQVVAAPSPTGASGLANPWGLLLVGLGTVVAVVAAAWLLVRRRPPRGPLVSAGGPDPSDDPPEPPPDAPSESGADP